MTRTSRTVLPLALAALLAACASSTDGGDARTGDASDAPADVPVTNPCAPGTCRFRAAPDDACRAPGGPIGGPDGGLSGCCGCGADGFCNAECVCAAPETPIATPDGPRPIAELAVGDRVYSIDGGRLVAVPLRDVRRRPVANHRVVRVVLGDGTVLRISAAHPTADGRTFGALRPGDWLGGRAVRDAAVVPYDGDATYDILPDSDTGTYFAGGALIGSTLAPARPGPSQSATACVLPARLAAAR